MDQEPTVRASIGDSLATVARTSTVDLAAKVRLAEPKDLVVVTTPAALEYGRAPRLLRLGVGRYLALTVDAGHVTGVTASPHLDALALDQALAAAAQAGGQLRAAGWDGAPATTPDAVRAAARGDSTGFFRAEVGRWTAGGDRAVIRIRQVADAAPAGARAAERRYVLSVEFENPDVARRFGDMAVQTIERQRAARVPD